MEETTACSGKNLSIKQLVVGELCTNCYLLVTKPGKNGLVIDPGFEGEEILTVIKRDSVRVEAILNTHCHLDHIGANDFLKAELGAPVWIGELDAAGLADPQQNLSFMTGFQKKILPADRRLKDGEELKIGTEVLTVLLTPGHTPGSIGLVADDYVITGDTLFADSIGRTDLPGGDEKEIFRSLKRLVKTIKGNPLILPGHGPVQCYDLVRKMNPFINSGNER